MAKNICLHCKIVNECFINNIEIQKMLFSGSNNNKTSQIESKIMLLFESDKTHRISNSNENECIKSLRSWLLAIVLLYLVTRQRALYTFLSFNDKKYNPLLYFSIHIQTHRIGLGIC